MAANIPLTLGNSTSLAVTSTTGVVALPAGTGTSIRICNDGTKTLFFKFGTSASVTAVTTDAPILGGAIEVFTIAANQTHLAGISAGSDIGTLRITRCEGS